MRQAQPQESHNAPMIYTIGHSNHAIHHFVSLLRQHNVNAIADVRSHPYSRYNPQFSKDELQAALDNANIVYVFLGKELGARPKDASYYDSDGLAVYDRIAEGQDFKDGLQRLTDGAKKYRIAIMCAEKDPLDCHRTILVCRHLKNIIPNIFHILADGSLKTQAEMEKELIGEHPNLLDTVSLINEAYNARERKIAYHEKAEKV